MQQDLQPEDPLSQVVFIHNYLQLVFQDSAYTLYNLATYSRGGVAIEQGQPGFCDALVALIDQRAEVHYHSESGLVIQFVGGASVTVPSSGPNTRGPEAWQFGRMDGPYVVEQNA
jgi:hypothetical protein